MQWVFRLYQEFLEKEFGQTKPDLKELQSLFEKAMEEGSLKILVQEPWMGTIRFKTLAVHKMTSPEITLLYENPMDYLRQLYGGGKFKVNFYRGMHFVATKNFKPEGEPRWANLQEHEEEL